MRDSAFLAELLKRLLHFRPTDPRAAAVGDGSNCYCVPVHPVGRWDASVARLLCNL